ncbi:MAG: hypothetical protein HZB39_18635 [Planctomycetes bacterium]|nr:hypothetical protein [Planctomycetota bacterium]
MANQKGKDAFAFVHSMLQKDPKVAYADVAAKAKAKGHKIYPVVFGRAKLLLGLVKANPAKKAKAAAKKAAKAAAKTAAAGVVRRGPGRPPKAKASALSGIDGIVQHIKGVERERDQLRATIEKLQSVLSTN